MNINLPADYYKTRVIDNFSVFPTTTDYTAPIYQRNPECKGRLTLNHLELIEFFVRLIKPKNFVELGVQFGELTNRIIPLIPGDYHGVDVEPQNNTEYLKKTYSNFKFYQMTTDNFFSQINADVNMGIDMAFIDACHSHEASYRDFLNLKNHMNPDGIIFLHDTYPCSSYWTDPNLSGDAYKTAEKIRKEHWRDFEILSIPVNPGISIAKKTVKQLEWLK
jgi:predicted O-methyltransferase YrrM